MRQTQKNSGFVHSQAYVKAIACLVLACGGGITYSSSKRDLIKPKGRKCSAERSYRKGCSEGCQW